MFFTLALVPVVTSCYYYFMIIKTRFYNHDYLNEITCHPVFKNNSIRIISWY